MSLTFRSLKEVNQLLLTVFPSFQAFSQSMPFGWIKIKTFEPNEEANFKSNIDKILVIFEGHLLLQTPAL